MKKNLASLVFSIALLTSCSTAYRSSQTPDDVYYSPGQKQMYAAANNQDRYESYSNSTDDDYLRMKVRDRDRWSSIDDYDYWYDSRYYYNNYYSPYSSAFSLGLGYGMGYGYGLGYGYSPYSIGSYWYNPWQSWYSPYYTVVYYKNPTVYYKPTARTNLTGFNNRNYNNYNMPMQTGNRSNAYNNSNSNVNRNNRNNNYYRPQNNNNNNNNNYTPSRSFNNSSSTSSGGGGSRPSGGGGGRTRP